ncbi:MAG: ribosome small subunit-dependent GTPase A [Burkholderiales bacterium]
MKNHAVEPSFGGEVVRAHGRHYIVQLADGSEIQAYPRGKKSLVACGDHVLVQRSGNDQGVIEAVDPRRTLLYRSDKFKQKLIAANVTQLAVVIASTPSFYDELITRCLVAASQQGLRALIVLNKSDLAAETKTAMRRLQVYLDLNYRVAPLSALSDASPLRPYLKGERTVLAGQSGMGKSTIINALLPEAKASVGHISLALDSGRHTTTYAQLYRLDEESSIIDSPGLQEFGLAHVTQEELVGAFPEFRPHLGQCRFTNCLHLTEPGCAITADTAVNEARLRAYQKLTRERQASANKY